MFSTAVSLFSLLLGTAILLLGVGMQGTLVALRANLEGFSVTATGVVMAAYFLGYALGTHYCPALVRRVGYIRSYAVFATIASAVGVTYPLLTGEFYWFILRLITGYCVVGLFLVIESWLNELAPQQGRGQFFGIYMVTTLLALAAGQYMLLLGTVSGSDLFAISTILLSVALVPVALTRVAQPPVVESAPLKLAKLYRQSPTGIVGGLVAGAVNGAFWSMTALFVHNLAADSLSVAMVVSVAILGGATLQIPLGSLSDRFDRRAVLALVAMSGAIVTLWGYLYPPQSLIVLLIGAFLFGAPAFSIYGICSAHINDRVSKEQMLDASRGLLQLFGVGAAIGPIIAGFTMQSLGDGAYCLYMSLCFGLFAVYAYFRRTQRDAVPEQEQVDFMPLSRTSIAALELDPRLHQADQPNSNN